MSSTDELSNVVPTSDPYEELLGPSPLRSSDPYEEVNIPGFSQRDETRDAVDAEFKSLHDHAARRELRRSRLQMETSVTVNTVHPGCAESSFHSLHIGLFLLQHTFHHGKLPRC